MSEPSDFANALLQNTRIDSDRLVILLSLTGEENLALGKLAVDQFGNRVPLADGSIALSQSEWVSGTPNVFGQEFTVDLGVVRSINRIRLLAGETALGQLEYFVRGYRLESSVQAQVWQLLSEEPANFRLNVDTRADSTWAASDADGLPVPREGRFVRLTLIRQDRSNWVALGEIEVYGQGFANEGAIEDGITLETSVNVGRIRWQSEEPAATAIGLLLRGASAGEELPAWDDVVTEFGGEFLFDGQEPVDQIEYRALLSNEMPGVTPSLRRIEIDYDPVLVAQELRGEVVGGDTIRKGSATTLTYRIQADVNSADYGIDMIRLQGVALMVEEIRVDGRLLEQDATMSEGFSASATAEREETRIEFAALESVTSSATIEIVGQALFLRDRVPVRFAAGSRRQAAADMYVNWQSGKESSTGSWTVLASGAPLQLLSKVQVEPRPYSPFAGGDLHFDMIVSNIEQGRDVTLRIFTLDGKRVRRLQQTGRARAYQFSWDGRDGDGQIVMPGLYLYEVGVSRSGATRRGTFAVAY